jgi:hypothetical protein
LLFQGPDTDPCIKTEIVEIYKKSKHAANLRANHARHGDAVAGKAGCTNKTKRAMIIVLRRQVKVKVAAWMRKSVAKSMESNRNRV